MQAGMLFHTSLDKNTSAYIEQSEVLLEGSFDPEIFKNSWRKIIERHDAFRSVFVLKKTARPIQVVLKEVSYDEYYQDVSDDSEDEIFRCIEDFKAQDIKKGFDVTKGPLFRLAVFKLDNNQHKVIWTFHHIIMDGWSLGLILDELFNIYASLKDQKQITLKTPVAYGNFIKFLESKNNDEGMSFWKENLKTLEQQTLLPQLKNQQKNYDLKIMPIALDKNIFDKINDFTKEQGITLNNYVLGIWALCLNLYTGQNDLVFGKTVSGRSADLPQSEDIVGLFINTIPVHIELQKDESFLSLLKRIQKESFASDEYDWCSLANIQNESTLKSNLINHIIVFENYPLDENNNEWDALNLGFKIKEVKGAEHTNYDFEIVAMPGESLMFDVKYNQSKYDKEMIAELMNTFLRLCEKGITSPESNCFDLNKIENTDYFLNEVNNNWPSTEAEIKVESVLTQFKKQVQLNPTNIALKINKKEISYQELDDRSNKFASFLINVHNVQPGQLVAAMIDRNEKAIISFFGIMKAGAAYIPLDPTYPQEKIDFMLEDSGVDILILDDAFQERTFDSFDGKRLLFEDVSSKSDLPTVEISIEDCAYIIYTSGSTGIPKGCMISHKNLGSLIQGSKFSFDFNNNDRWVIAHSLCFDFSVWEMYGALCFGGTLYIPTKEVVSDTKSFYSFLAENKITVLNQTPAAFYQIIQEDALQNDNALSAIRTVCFGGDRLDLKPIREWANKYPLDKTKLVNMFGITETTVHVSYKHITNQDLEENQGESPIGIPIPYVSMIILDSHQRIVPINVTGEIYVGGAGVSLGYLNRESLTSERFIQNPYDETETLYRSGDLGYRNEQGEIIYLGRNDFQVQIRGFRVELGEISFRLQEIKNVKDAVILAKKDGDRDDRLIAFYTSENKQELDPETIKSELRHHLAEYMVPPQIYFLQEFPLTSNNKIDRKALLSLEEDVLSKGLAESYVAPRNDLEKEMIDIWQEILGLDKIGVEDDFFEIGGHSIKATLLMTKLSKSLSVDFSLKEIFESRTIANLAHIAQFKKPSLFAEITKAPTQEYHELSYAQKRLWTLDKIQGGSIAYNLHGAFHLTGSLDLNLVEKAFLYIVGRHESLRLQFIEIDGVPYQKSNQENIFKILSDEVSSLDEANSKCLEEIEWAFDLSKGNLFRVKVLKISDQKSVLSICIHHIVCDGWSIGILLKEFTSIYNSFEDHNLEELNIQYTDFTHWQNDAIRSSSMLSQREYWLNTLKGEVPVLELPTDYTRPSEKSFNGSLLHFDLPEDLFQSLKSFNESNKLTLFMGLIGFYNLLLHKYTHQKEIIIGIPISGRYHSDLNNQVGYYLNTLPIKITIDPNESLASYYKKLKNNVKNAFENQVYPFDELMDELELENNPSRSGLYDVMFGLQNFDQGEIGLTNIKSEVLDIDSPTSKFDLTMVCEEKNNKLSINLEFATDLFKTETIEQLKTHFIQLVNASLSSADEKIKDINLLSEIESINIIEKFNEGAKVDPSTSSNKGIIDYFNEMVDKYPDNIAISTSHEKLSYTELNNLSNQIAHLILSAIDFNPEDKIGIYATRSPWMIACILGILKTGAAYVPVDTKNPIERSLFLFKDSQSKLILTEKSFKDELIETALPLIIEDDIQNTSSEKLLVSHNPNHLVYVMYTSGSSGTPKGVLVEQKSVIALVKNTNYTSIKPTDHILQLSNYSFDGCVFDIFGALLHGASLQLINHDMLLSPNLLCDFIKEQNINITFITTALINTLVDIDPEIIRQFDKIYFGGQEASLKHIQKALEYRKNKDSIVHVYGPTETTTFASYYVIDSIDEKTGNIPIGSALSQDQLYLLDDHMNPVPVGVTGEIFISGAGVARSYLNRPEETAKVFLENPFDDNYHLYKTNDIGRWTSEGQIEFLGRKDLQVKIRGFRVEIGEVENAILRNEAIEKVFVMAWSEYKGANKQLVAYFVTKKELNKNDLRKWLSSFLPDYMIPAHMIAMEELPLNANGKVERKKLPSPADESHEADEQYIAPKSKSEEILESVWCKLLGRKKISVQDNYFSLGGDSIKAIQMIAALRNQHLKMEIKDLYSFPTIEGLSQCLVLSDTHKTEKREVCEFPLLPIQSWFLKEKKGSLDHFNQDILIKWNGSLDETILENSINAIIDHHDLFRASLTDNKTLDVKDNANVPIQKIKLASNDEEELLTTTLAINLEMNLHQGPLIKVALINTPDGSDYLYIVIHHMIVDGVSWRILLEDLENSYKLNSKNNEFKRSSSSKSWAEFLLNTDQFNVEIDYWMNLTMAKDSQLPLETLDQYEVKIEDRTLDAELTKKFLTNAHESFNTETNDLLLMALSLSFQKIHGQKSSLIYLEGHGREELSDTIDLSHTIGWFTSMFPVAIACDENEDLATQVKRFKESLRTTPHKGLGYGVLKYLQNAINVEYYPSASFNYLGQFESGPDEGLFTVSSLKTGKTNADHLALTCPIDIVAYVESNQLKVSVSYAHSSKNQSLVNSLLDSYVDELSKIINFCCETDDSGITPSDIDIDGFDVDMLDNVLDNL